MVEPARRRFPFSTKTCLTASANLYGQALIIWANPHRIIPTGPATLLCSVSSTWQACPKTVITSIAAIRNKDEETLHILPHWNWEGREGQVTPVFVYTNHPSAELFINGKSQGKRTKDLSVNVNNSRRLPFGSSTQTSETLSPDVDGYEVRTGHSQSGCLRQRR